VHSIIKIIILGLHLLIAINFNVNYQKPFPLKNEEFTLNYMKVGLL
jgi:hypothetical protein